MLYGYESSRLWVIKGYESSRLWVIWGISHPLKELSIIGPCRLRNNYELLESWMECEIIMNGWKHGWNVKQLWIDGWWSVTIRLSFKNDAKFQVLRWFWTGLLLYSGSWSFAQKVSFCHRVFSQFKTSLCMYKKKKEWEKKVSQKKLRVLCNSLKTMEAMCQNMGIWEGNISLLIQQHIHLPWIWARSLWLHFIPSMGWTQGWIQINIWIGT